MKKTSRVIDLKLNFNNNDTNLIIIDETTTYFNIYDKVKRKYYLHTNKEKLTLYQLNEKNKEIVQELSAKEYNIIIKLVNLYVLSKTYLVLL